MHQPKIKIYKMSFSDSRCSSSQHHLDAEIELHWILPINLSWKGFSRSLKTYNWPTVITHHIFHWLWWQRHIWNADFFLWINATNSTRKCGKLSLHILRIFNLFAASPPPPPLPHLSFHHAYIEIHKHLAMQFSNQTGKHTVRKFRTCYCCLWLQILHLLFLAHIFSYAHS
jgi:hypothetical protein